MAKPNFFLVGAPKCATTSLCHYLSQHPDIFISDPKELHFFASDLDLPRPDRSADEYLKRFACTSKSQTGEGSPWYLYSSTAAQKIHDFIHDAKIIAIVRDPIDMVYSLFRYRLYTGTEKSRSFSEVLVREKEYFASIKKTVKIDTRYIYSNAAMYSEQIRRYIQTFNAGSVHVVMFDDIMDNPESVYLGILQFLGVSDDFRPTFRTFNQTGRIRSERFQQRIAHLPGPVKRLAYAFPRAIRRPAYRALHRLNTSFAPAPPLEPALRERLNNDFRPDVERLSALIGRDLTHWCAE